MSDVEWGPFSPADQGVGPTLRKRDERPQDDRGAFLGHAVGGTGTSRWYEGDVDEHYLTKLVSLIGTTCRVAGRLPDARIAGCETSGRGEVGVR